MELKYLVDPETFDKTLNEESRAIAELIDTLKDMALVDKRAGVPTILEFDSKLQELYPKRKELDEKVRELKNVLAKPEEFFLDRELELSDEQELLRITKDIAELESQKSSYEDEKKPHLRRQESLRKDIDYYMHEVDRLEEISPETFKDAIDTYNVIITEDDKNLEETEESLRKYDGLIAEINRKLLPLNKKKDDLEKKLQNRSSYIDHIKKAEIEKEFKRISKELNEIEDEIKNISSHPVYLASTARYSLKGIGSDPLPLKNIIKQLADIARRGPHMDTPQADIASLDEKKEHLVKERDRAYREKQNSNGLVKPLETRINNFVYGEEDFTTTLKTWLDSAKNKQDELTSEIKKVLEDKNRLAEEIAYRKKLKPEDTKPEMLRETSTLEQVKVSYDRAYNAYLNELTLYQNLIKTINNVLNNEIATLEESYNTSLNEDLQSTVDSLKEHKISFLGTKSRIDKEVDELMMEVVGIEHRKKFENSPSEIETIINEKIDALQAKFDEQMHTFFAPKADAEKIKEAEPDITSPVAPKEDEEDYKDLIAPTSLEEIPVIDLQAATTSDHMGEPTINGEPGYIKEEKPTYTHEPVGEYFGEVEAADDTMVKTSEIPAFNPIDEVVSKEEETPDLESGEPLRVTGVQELGVTSEEEQARPADFTTIIPQDAPAPDDGVDFSELDSILNGSVGRGR